MELGLTEHGVKYRVMAYRAMTGNLSRPSRATITLEECEQVWEVLGQSKDLQDCADRMGLTRNQVKTRLYRYREHHGLAAHVVPDGLERRLIQRELDREGLVRRSWLAWETGGTQREGAELLGIGLHTLRMHCKEHRLNTGMPEDATPRTHLAMGSLRPLPD